MFLFPLAARSTVDVRNKALKKELKKYYPDELYSLKEMPSSDKQSLHGTFYKVTPEKGNQELKYVYMGRVYNGSS